MALERSWEALADIAESGRAAGIGLSEVSVEQIQRAQRIYPVAAVQSELSLWSREPLDEVLPCCAEQGIAFIACSPLGRGFLSGAISGKDELPTGDWRRRNPRFQDDAVRINSDRILTPVRECADEAVAVSRDVVAL